MDVSIPKALAELLIGVCNELLAAWPDSSDASDEEEAEKYTEDQAKVISIRDDLAERTGLSNSITLP